MSYRTISVDVDDQTEIGLVGTQYVRFDGENFISMMDPTDVLRTYVTSYIHIPEQFVEVRQKLQELL